MPGTKPCPAHTHSHALKPEKDYLYNLLDVAKGAASVDVTHVGARKHILLQPKLRFVCHDDDN